MIVSTKYVYDKGLIGEEVSGAFKTYHFDCRGSTIAITDASGTITDTFAYDTYGKLISRTDTTKIIFGYNGRDGVVTDDIGLIYMRARYYSPDMKRFVNADIVAGQISNAITLNRFAYANGNPVSFVDPFGLFVNWWKETERQIKDGWNTYVAEPFQEYIAEPISETWNTYVAEPVAEVWDTYVVEPVNEYVVQPIKENIVDPIVETYHEAKDWVDANVIKPREKAYTNAKRQIKDGFTTVANAISDNVGAKVSVGKEVSNPPKYYFFATVEDGIGYSKDFGSEKPVNFFASAGENWWEFWEWSVGVDVNINGYGGGISIGGETSINVHAGNVSHEVGVNALGRVSHKVAYHIEDGYIYSKYSLNGPEIAATAIGVYYAVPVVVPAIISFLSSLGGAVPQPIVNY